MSFLDLFSPKKIKQNLSIVRRSPYNALKFQYMLSRVLIGFVIILIIWQIVSMIIKLSSGSQLMTLITQLVLAVVGVIIVLRMWGTLAPLKEALKQYEAHPISKNSMEYKDIDIGEEVDSILENIEHNKLTKEKGEYGK